MEASSGFGLEVNFEFRLEGRLWPEDRVVPRGAGRADVLLVNLAVVDWEDFARPSLVLSVRACISLSECAG